MSSRCPQTRAPGQREPIEMLLLSNGIAANASHVLSTFGGIRFARFSTTIQDTGSGHARQCKKSGPCLDTLGDISRNRYALKILTFLPLGEIVLKIDEHKTACNRHIVVPSRVQDHLQAHPDVIKYLPEAIAKIQLPRDNKKIECEVQMGRVIGQAGVVKTSVLGLDDLAMFALRTNRKFPSRIAPPGVAGTDATSIVVIAKPHHSEDYYELITAWVGLLAKKEPWDSSIVGQAEFDDCLRFWSTTALVFDPTTMGPVSEKSWREVLVSAKSKFC